MSVPSFGIVTHAVGHEPMPFVDCLEKIAAASGEHILFLTSPQGPSVLPGQPSPSHYPDVLSSDPDELLRVAAASGLRIGALLPFIANDISSESAAEATRAAFAPYVAYADRIGCRALCISAPRPSQPGLPTSEKAEGLRRLAGLMDALASASADPAFTVTVDIHYNTLVETVDDCRVLVEAMTQPGAGLLLNIGHLTTCGQQGWRLVEEYPDRIHTVGWKDHSLAPDRPSPVYSIELGTGDSPFERYVRAFKQTNPPRTVHFVNVEHPPRGDEVPTLQRSLDYLRNLWSTVQ